VRVCLVLVATALAGCSFLGSDGRAPLHQGPSDGGMAADADGPPDGACSGGCVLATSTDPHAIAVDATHVYWTSPGLGVMKVPKAGGATVTLATGVPGATGLTVDARAVYWTNIDEAQGRIGIMTVPLAGGAPVLLASYEEWPLAVAVDATHVYWTTGVGVPGDHVLRTPLAGGPAEPIASGQTGASDLAVDAANVYWVTCGDGTVMKAPLAGGEPVTLATESTCLQSLAIDAANVYWTGLDLGAIMTVPIEGGAPVVLAENPSYGTECLAIDETYVYWATYTRNVGPENHDPDGELRRVAKAGGEVVTLAIGLNAPHDLVVDATSIYWVDYVTGTINRLDK
jgi:hypothetical protein